MTFYREAISRKQAREAIAFTKAMLESTRTMATNKPQVIDSKAITKAEMSGSDILKMAVRSANTLENVAPEWTTLSKEDMEKLPYFMIVSAELQVSNADREFYLFGIIGPGMDTVEKVPFGKGNIAQRDAI